MMAVTPTKTPPEDMWERVMREYREDLERYPPTPPPPRATTWEEREEISDRAMIEGLKAAGDELFFENTAPAVHARIILGRSPRPRLVATNNSAVWSGNDRFRGRYQPHLVCP
jgi:hypothetical protein